MEEVRLRLDFQRRILSDDQKAQGIKRCWLLLKPKLHKTIGSLSSHILQSFNFQHACPFGLSLFMDGYFLPPFESTALFHDKDIVRVKRKENECRMENDNVKMLSNGAVGISSGSESEQDEENMDSLHEEQNDGNPNMKDSKKRKVPRIFDSSQEKMKKKKKLESVMKESEKNDTDAATKKLQTIEMLTKSPSRSARRKKAKRKWLRELRNAQNEHADQSAQRKASDTLGINSNKTEESDKSSDSCEESEKNSDKSDEESENEETIVPVVIKPGHIRFQSTKTAVNETQLDHEPSLVNSHWSNTSKKKGQRWGTEKDNCSNWNHTETPMIVEEDKVEDASPDFHNLGFYNCSPKVGDVIAYKMIELTSSWTPEMSSYRVGKIREYDMESDRIVLEQVEEYPFPRSEDGDEYNEDGSLEICFASLMEVRLVRGKEGVSSEQREDEGRILEVLREMVEKKKKEIVEVANRNEIGECNKRRGRRSLRSSALGPVLARLRSEHFD